jgi:prepilin signal peptidase PulO-like enzyme (type II secretory pathway)
MSLFIAIWFFIFGAIIGSFLNVVVNRLETGESLGGRSHCPHCKKTLRWFDLVPIFSYLMLRAKCRHCKKRISIQYPLVEFLTAVLFLSVFLAVPDISLRVFLLPITAFLVAITAYDTKHTIIPDEFVYPFIFLSGCALFFHQGHFGMPGWWALAAGPLLFLPFFLIWFFSGGRAMGFGDAKLAWGIGWLLGPFGGFSAIIIATWAGAAYGVAAVYLPRLLHRFALFDRMSVRTMESEIPFAPFLIFGLYLVLFTGWNPINLFL